MLEHPPLIKPNPGDPITSESWRNVVDSILNLYTEHNAWRSILQVQVIDSNGSEPIKNAVVTVADSLDDPTFVRSGKFVGASLNYYLVDDLPAGSYEMSVEAEGYDSEQREFVMTEDPDQAPLVVEMTPLEVTSPISDFFGMTLSAVLSQRASKKFQVTDIITTHGDHLSAGGLSPEENNALVVNQVPEAGSPVPANVSVKLLVSAKAVEAPSVVQVPNLLNLTYDQAKAILKEVGLNIAPPTYITH